MRYCVIMCGGVGSRLWPYSRNARPKQFLDFLGCGRSLLQLTVERIAPLIPQERIILVTNKDYVDIIREQLPDIRPENILAEPARRNTAPCILWATRHIAAADPEASIAVLSSDHFVLRERAFCDALEECFDFAEREDAILTLGIQPSHPNTGYGYIQRGNRVEGWEGLYKVKAFTEKPELDMAKVFFDSGEFFWNAGIFIWRASTVMEAFKEHADYLWSLFDSCSGDYATEREAEAVGRIFLEARSISIDYAVMENARNVYVKAADIGWSDLGTWNALYDLSPKTPEGNVTQNCRTMVADCSGSIFVASPDKMIVAAGLHDYIVVDHGNALLIFPRDREQEVKAIVTSLGAGYGDEFM